jgi:hypothetical protein
MARVSTVGESITSYTGGAIVNVRLAARDARPEAN